MRVNNVNKGSAFGWAPAPLRVSSWVPDTSPTCLRTANGAFYGARGANGLGA